MFTVSQLIAHAVGDYVLQSDWMATNKTKSMWPAAAHAIVYTLPFLLITQSVYALLFICLTHLIIDHFRLARYLCWIKNFIAPRWIHIETEFHCHKCDKYKYLSRSMPPSCCGGLMDARDRKLINYPWRECSETGYHRSRPAWLTVWLLIITDNLMHVMCNALAITFM